MRGNIVEELLSEALRVMVAAADTNQDSVELETSLSSLSHLLEAASNTMESSDLANRTNYRVLE